MTGSGSTTTKRILCALIALVIFVCGVSAGCTNDAKDGEKTAAATSGAAAAAQTEAAETTAGEKPTAQAELEAVEHPQVRFTVQVDGEKPFDFVLELYPEIAPITCENFLSLVTSGFYNGKTFHRIVDNFMVQGGDPNGNGSGGTTPIKGEFAANGVNNPLSHTRGVISMARRSNDYNSGSCQFFICYSDRYTGSLDGQYAAFGKVIDGMEGLDALQNLERVMGNDNYRSRPVKNVVIQSAVLCGADEGAAEQ